MKVAFLGATKGMGRAVARGMAERGDTLVLLGRSMRDLERSARDLEARGAQKPVHVHVCDLEKPETFESVMVAADRAVVGLDTVVVTGGMFAEQEELENDLALTKKLLDVNFTNTMLFCEAARSQLLAHGGGTLCVFSSVAGDRGRSKVITYGASKAGLSAYLEGLDHKFRKQGLRVVCVKPGFVKTSMTQGLQPPPFSAEAEDVVKPVLRAIDRGTPEVYVPGVWRYVMMAVRSLPRAVMRRASF